MSVHLMGLRISYTTAFVGAVVVGVCGVGLYQLYRRMFSERAALPPLLPLPTKPFIWEETGGSTINWSKREIILKTDVTVDNVEKLFTACLDQFPKCYTFTAIYDDTRSNERAFFFRTKQMQYGRVSPLLQGQISWEDELKKDSQNQQAKVNVEAMRTYAQLEKDGSTNLSFTMRT